MRRLILTVLALSLCILASAEAPKPALRLGWSMFPIHGATLFGDESEPYYHELQYLYKDYHTDIRSAGNFHLTCDLEFSEWITGSMYLAYAGFSTDRFDGHTGEKTGVAKGKAFYVAPHIRFTYYRSDLFRVYGTIGGGCAIYSGFQTKHVAGVIQFNPAGFEFGRRFFGFAELGFGSLFMGAHMGVGFKF